MKMNITITHGNVHVALNGVQQHVLSPIFSTEDGQLLHSFVLRTSAMHSAKQFTFMTEDTLEESESGLLRAAKDVHMWHRFDELTYGIMSRSIIREPERGMIFVIYQDARSFLTVMQSLKERVIDPLSANFHFGLVISLGTLEKEIMLTKPLIFDKLVKYDLIQYLLLFKLQFPGAILEFTDILDLTFVQTNSSEWNPAHALFSQVAQRHLAAAEAKHFLVNGIQTPSGKTYDYVAFLRSDVAYGYVDFSDLIKMGRTAANKEAVVWVPSGANFDGANDRISFFTKFGFLRYAEKIINKTIDWMLMAKTVHGESFHRHIMRSTPRITVRDVPMCYGLFRMLECQWSSYGEDECAKMNRPLVSSMYDVDISCSSPRT